MFLSLGAILSAYVFLDAYSIRGPLYYLTRFLRKFEQCWAKASLKTKRITLFTGPDEMHVIRSIRWQDLCQAVAAKEGAFHVVMVDRTHHLRANDASTMQVWVTAINSAADNS